MGRGCRWGQGAAVAAVLAVLLGGLAIAAFEAQPAYTNLQVLPADISRAELGAAMLANLQGLGLPRRAGEGCLQCHVGSLETPRVRWDYASDEKPLKEKARVMMAMVRQINTSFLASLDTRSEPAVSVTCYTCHAGRLNPTPLPDLLIAEYRREGMDALARTYRTARARYHEADAYDFRLDTLIGVANRLVDMGELDAAAEVHELNLEFYDHPRAHGGLIRLRLVQVLETDGLEAMVARYHALKNEHPSEAFAPLMLDSLGWRLFRGGREESGLRLFELNHAEHPAAFVSFESVAWAYQLSGDHQRGLEVATRWATANPDHREGQRLLDELRRSGQN